MQPLSKIKLFFSVLNKFTDSFKIFIQINRWQLVIYWLGESFESFTQLISNSRFRPKPLYITACMCTNL